MALFQEAIIRKYLRNLDEEVIESAFKEYKRVYSPEKIKNIRVAKEEQYQEGFIKEIFGSVLGYSVYPESPYNIETEKKNETNSKKADGAILKDEKVVGVIELKDNKTKNLDAVKDQAFGYKNNHKECSYVISSNFHKLRFYIDDATEYEEFDLYNLDKETFKRFYLYLRKEGLLDKNIPKLLRQETKFHEEEISKKLYKDYSNFKRSFFKNALKNNPEFDKLSLFKKSQKFLDRVLFILFAEDKGLVTTNSVVQIVEKWQSLKDDAFDTPRPLYNLILLFFNNLYQGKKDNNGTVLIPEFGGELFAPDEVLDQLSIDDEVLKDDLLKLSKYDFNTDVDVNILGHIFEHSLNEVDDVEAELRGEQLDKTKSKRKKDGVFYTPKYITKYIVDNTLGKLCSEKKIELNLNDDIAIYEYLKSDSKLNEKGKNLYERLNSFKTWLLTVTVCDPACGSGAFLNQALSYFIEEHKFVDDLIAELTNTPLRLFDTELQILENNIFGVDINEESVEIAKLSLWLRTAQPGRKLSNLSNNIKCGNSLIDDSEVAGDKAFNWEKEFPCVFEKGGFDVVIGNPPYVNVELMPIFEKDFYKANYKTFFKRSDLFSLFIELSIDKLTSTGRVSFIIPSIVLNNLSYKRIRDLILDNNWLEEVCYTGGKVFDDATVDSTILILNKGGRFKEISLKNALDFFNPIIQAVPFGYFEKYDQNISVGHGDKNEITDKLFSKDFLLCESYFQIFQGVVTGNNDAFIFNTKEETKEKGIEDDIIFSMCHGRDISKWSINNRRVIAYLDSKTDISRLQGANLWLTRFYEQLMDRRECKNGVIPWYSLQWPREKEQFLHFPKILIQNTRNESLRPRIVATIDEEGLFGTQGLNFIIPTGEIDIYAMLGLLNSKLINYLFATKFLNLAIKADYLKKIQFPVELKSSKIKDLSKELSDKYKVYHTESSNFIKLIQIKFGLGKISKKLENWYMLDFASLLSEFKKAKITLDFYSEEKLMIYFEEKKNLVYGLKSQIDQTDKEIDRMVYELYGLTEEEIQIVENS